MLLPAVERTVNETVGNVCPQRGYTNLVFQKEQRDTGWKGQKTVSQPRSNQNVLARGRTSGQLLLPVWWYPGVGVALTWPKVVR